MDMTRKTTHTTRKTARTTSAAAAASMFEALEDRRLMSSVLTVNGTAGDDLIRLTQRGHLLSVQVNGVTRAYNTLRISGVKVAGQDGNDTIAATGGFTLPVILSGGNGDDSLVGGRGNDRLDGGPGNDRLAGDQGADDLFGGDGVDTADYSAYSAAVNVSLDDVANDGAAEGDNVHSNVENVVGGSGNDTLTGSSAANYLQGAGGTDTIYGLGGDDTLDGGVGGLFPLNRNNGNDALWGGDGNDTLYASDFGNNSLYGEAGNDRLFGYSGADKLYGASGRDSLYGGGNDDELFGGTGDDYLDAGAGNDKAYGNAGPISIFRPITEIGPIVEIGPVLGGASIQDGTSNTVQFSEAGAINPLLPIDRIGTVVTTPVVPVIDPTVVVNPTLPPIDTTPRLPVLDPIQVDVLHPWLPPFTVAESDNDEIHGGDGSDRLRGDGGNDAISGEAGDDVCYGDAGNDVVHGNAGNDRLYGGAGDDDLYGDENDDILVSIGGGQRDSVTGGDGLDSIWCDAESTEIDTNGFWDALFEGAAGTHHRVGGFQTLRTSDASNNTISTQTPSRELNGQAILDPVAGGGSYADFSDRPLFGTGGPSKDDVDQNGIGDCYYLAGLSAAAKVNPLRIKQAVVDLGDGTYAVRFYSGGTEQYYRVDGDLPTYGGSSMVYAGLGHDDNLWTAVLEKVFTFARSNKGTYASIHGGGMAEYANSLNVTGSSVWGSNAVDTLKKIKAEVDAHRAVTVLTPNTTPPAGTHAVPWHVYSVESVTLQTVNFPLIGSVVIGGTITLRNPWATDGGGNDDGSNDGYVTFTADQFYGFFTAGYSSQA
jgi:Ca2+-binding RTX toxin-like protein